MNQALARDIRTFEQEASLRVLLAEDNGHFRRLLALALRRDGHEVIEAGDGAEMLEALASTLVDPAQPPFDLVICEQTLPGIPGLTVLAGLRSRDRRLPFILMTGNADVQARARRLGAIILDMPFNLHAIRGAIRDAGAATCAPL